MRTHKKYTYNPKNGNNSAILNHINCKKCVGKEENFKIIGSAHNDYHLCLKESLLIQKLKPKINTNENSVPLKLFWLFCSFWYAFILFIFFIDFMVSFSDLHFWFLLFDLPSFSFFHILCKHPLPFFFVMTKKKRKSIICFSVNYWNSFN